MHIYEKIKYIYFLKVSWIVAEYACSFSHVLSMVEVSISLN